MATHKRKQMAMFKESAKKPLLSNKKKTKIDEDCSSLPPPPPPELTEQYVVETVLSTLSDSDFENYMLRIGPEAWKNASQTLPVPVVKHLFNKILRHAALQPAFAVFQTLWEQEETLATFLFEMGLGGFIQQSLVPSSAKKHYILKMRMDADISDICPMVPTLQHKYHYFCLNSDFAIKKDLDKSQKRLDPASLTPEEIFFKKMSSSLACLKFQRWSECFAFSLSALDDFQPQFGGDDVLHDLLCNIALSGTKNAVPLDWCCKILEDAKECATGLDHFWKRILAFQAVLIQNGFFDLEYEVFHQVKSIFLQVSDHFQTLLIQHLQAKLFQVEFNLVFQFVRQNFHFCCYEFCKKDPCFKQSGFTTRKLLSQLDTLAQAVTVRGVKEYFKGYYYLYSTMLQLHVQKSDKNTLLVQLSINFFQLAKYAMKSSETFYQDLSLIIEFLKKTPLTTTKMSEYFEKKSVTQNTEGASHFFFRAMLITMYWDNYYQPFPYTMLATHTKEFEMKLTNKQGYKIPLLTSSIDIPTHQRDPKTPQDYPNISLTKEQSGWLKQANQYWSKEMSSLPTPTTTLTNVITRSSSRRKTAKCILNKNKRAEQVYAFGKQVVEAWTYI